MQYICMRLLVCVVLKERRVWHELLTVKDVWYELLTVKMPPIFSFFFFLERMIVLFTRPNLTYLSIDLSHLHIDFSISISRSVSLLCLSLPVCLCVCVSDWWDESREIFFFRPDWDVMSLPPGGLECVRCIMHCMVVRENMHIWLKLLQAKS